MNSKRFAMLVTLGLLGLALALLWLLTGQPANAQPSEITVCPAGPPEAGFTYTLPALVNVPIDFTNTTTWCAPYPITYTWNLGDGSPPAATVAPSHTYTAPGPYTVWLTASMYCGCDDWVHGVYSRSLYLAGPGSYLYLPLVVKNHRPVGRGIPRNCFDYEKLLPSKKLALRSVWSIPATAAQPCLVQDCSHLLHVLRGHLWACGAVGRRRF